MDPIAVIVRNQKQAYILILILAILQTTTKP